MIFPIIGDRGCLAAVLEAAAAAVGAEEIGGQDFGDLVATAFAGGGG